MSEPESMAILAPRKAHCSPRVPFSDLSGAQLANWVEIGICSEKAMPDSRIAVLTGGYVQQNAPIAWTGNIQLEKTWQIYIALQSSTDSRVRLAITTDRSS